MKRPVPFRCPEVEDPLGRCRDFTPSYSVSEMVVPWRREGKAKPSAIKALPGVVASYLGLDRASVTLQTPLITLTDPKVLKEASALLEASDLPLIAEEAGLPPLTGNMEALLAQGLVIDLAQDRSSTPESLYRTKVEQCRGLTADSTAFREAGCKREAHVVVPRGRLHFLQPSTYRPVEAAVWAEKAPYAQHELTAQTKRRLDNMEPPLSARTQSPNVRAEDPVEAMRKSILASFDTYVQAEQKERIRQAEAALTEAVNPTQKRQARRKLQDAKTFGQSGFWLPESPRRLLMAGMPEEAAQLLVLKLGGQWISRSRDQESDLHEAIVRIFGGYSLRIGSEIDPNAYFDLSSRTADLRNLQGPGRREDVKKLFQLYKKLSKGSERLPVQRIVLLNRRNQIILPIHKGLSAFAERLKAETSKRRDWTLRLTLGRTIGPLLDVDLQHSELQAAAGEGRVTDYVGLQGLPLPELARVLARQTAKPRRARRGRRTSPFPSARSNPMPTYTLPPDIKQRMKPGSWIAYSLGAVVVPGRPDESTGKVVYLSTKPGAEPQVTTAARVAAWLTVAEKGHKLSQLSRGAEARPLIPALAGQQEGPRLLPERNIEPQVTTTARAAANPRRIPTMARHRSRRNPDTTSDFNEPLVAPWEKMYPVYSDKSLSTDMALNRLSEYYYPGTAWDYYAEGSYGPSESSPVNRRNPRPPRSAKEKASRAQASRVLTRAQQIAKASGCDFQAAVRAAWAEIKGQRAAANPLIYQGLDHGPYWPRVEYEQRIGAYGTDLLPPNRRNPAGGVKISRWDKPCSICGESMKGQEIADTGARGPKGGKRMAHVNCMR